MTVYRDTGARFAHSVGVNRDTLGLAGGTALVGILLLLFLFGPLPLAERLYRAGLWPRLTPDQLRQEFSTRHHLELTGCSKDVNGWDYVCELSADPKRHLPYDKIAVMGSVYGIGSIEALPPGPLPDRAAHEAEDRLERGQRNQRNVTPEWIRLACRLLLAIAILYFLSAPPK
jgi:hypothetical protein